MRDEVVYLLKQAAFGTACTFAWLAVLAIACSVWIWFCGVLSLVIGVPAAVVLAILGSSAVVCGMVFATVQWIECRDTL